MVGSIRGRGHHSIIVQPRKSARVNGIRALVNDGDPFRIDRCAVQSVREWATAEELMTYGLQLISMLRVFTRVSPGDHNSLIYFDGGEYEVVGNVQRMDASKRTAHFLTTMRWLGNGPEPVLPSPTPPSDPLDPTAP